MKRFISMIVVLCCLIGLCPMHALAVTDNDPPKITGAYLSAPGAELKAGDDIGIDIIVTDESELDFAWVFAYLVNEDGSLDTSHGIGGSWIPGLVGANYDASTGVLSIRLKVESDDVDGVYRIEEIYVMDKFGNATCFTGEKPGSVDFSTLWLSVSGNGRDLDSPQLLSAEFVNQEMVVKYGDIVNLILQIADASEIIRVEGDLYLADCDELHYIHIFAQPPCKGEDDSFLIDIPIPDDAVDGEYYIGYLEITDKFGNISNYAAGGSSDVELEKLRFNVVGNSTDREPPEVQSVQLLQEGATVQAGDVLDLYITASDANDVHTYIGLYYMESDPPMFVTGRWHGISSDENEDKFSGVFHTRIVVEETAWDGMYCVREIDVSDTYNNSVRLDVDHPGHVDFSKLWFVVSSSDNGPEKVSLPESVQLPVRSVYTLTPDVTPIGATTEWTWKSDDSSVATASVADDGTAVTITGLKVGTTTITGTTSNGLSASTVVTVTDAALPESGIVADSYNVPLSELVDIHPVLTPSGATSQYDVTSDNPHVASVEICSENNTIRIRGNNAGKANLTIRGANGLLMTTTIVVGSSTDKQHEKVVEAGYASTCTTHGRTDAVRCSACNYYFVEAQELPLADHTYSNWIVDREPSTSDPGLRHRTCSVCGYTEQDGVPLPVPSVSPVPTSTPEPSPVPTATPEPQNAAVGDQDIAVSVKDSTADLKVSDTQLGEVVESAAKEGVLTVDVSKLDGVSNVKLPKNLVDAVVDNEEINSLTLKTASGDITLDGDALKTVAGTVTGEHDEISLSVKTIDPDDIPASQKYPIAPVLNRAVFIELSADVIHKDTSGKVTGTDAIHEFNGDVTVSVPYEQPENMQGRKIIACHIADDGSITYFNVTYKDGIATFTTVHFSTFAIVESYAAAFEDIDLDKWYMTSVEYALAHELMAGESDTLFAPDEKVSRAMAVQLLYNLSGQPEVAEPATFADVDAYAWYASAIAWAEDKEVVAGYSKDQFAPADLVTREQLATMLWQYAGRPETTGSIDTYADAADVSSWAKEALCWAAENGIMQGSANYLNPKATASRAEAAVLMANLYQVQETEKMTNAIG